MVGDAGKEVEGGRQTPVPTLPEIEHDLAEKQKAANQTRSAKFSALKKAAVTHRAQQAARARTEEGLQQLG